MRIGMLVMRGVGLFSILACLVRLGFNLYYTTNPGWVPYYRQVNIGETVS